MSSLITQCFKELLKELYIILINADILNDFDIELKLTKFIRIFLFEYDLDPQNTFKILTRDSKNTFRYYTSIIGFFYHKGIGCKVDKIKAFEIFSKAARKNEITPDDDGDDADDGIKKLNEIILKYFYSLYLYKDVIIDRKNQYKFNIKNARNGDNVSQYYIGHCYYYGKYVEQNYDKAFEWYSKSSEGGNIKATFILGLCYYTGTGVKIDEKKAFELYLKSAKGGYRLALLTVGQCYFNGYGISKDESKAFEWYLKAAEKGSSYSQYIIANYYNDGKYIQKNEEKGFYWNRKAAINDHRDAQYKLADHYFNGPINKNERKAFDWYFRLSNKHFRKLEADYLVAKCYRDGIGTDLNLDKARIWILKHEYSVFCGFYDNYRIEKSIIIYDFLNGSNI
jgi:TPR repeat protein